MIKLTEKQYSYILNLIDKDLTRFDKETSEFASPSVLLDENTYDIRTFANDVQNLFKDGQTNLEGGGYNNSITLFDSVKEFSEIPNNIFNNPLIKEFIKFREEQDQPF